MKVRKVASNRVATQPQKQLLRKDERCRGRPPSAGLTMRRDEKSIVIGRVNAVTSQPRDLITWLSVMWFATVRRFPFPRGFVVVDEFGESRGRSQGSVKGFIPRKLPKLDLTTDAEYVANLVSMNMWL